MSPSQDAVPTTVSPPKTTATTTSTTTTTTTSELEATEAMCYHCFVTLTQELQGKPPTKASSWRSPFRTNNNNNNKRPIPDYAKALPDPSMECPLFVTWDKQRPKTGLGFPANLLLRNSTAGGDSSSSASAEPVYDLRGCIGSLSPKPLLTSIGDYALNSALRDRRFHPVVASEIPNLRVAVSLLVKYEVCDNYLDWQVGIHGILIKFWSSAGDNRDYSATYLPEVAKEQGWDQKQAVTALVRKSGYAGRIDQELLDKIHCTRYQSSKKRMTYDEFVHSKKRKRQQQSPPSTEPSSASSSFHQQDVERDHDEEEEKEEEQQVNELHSLPRNWNTCNNL